ncbi:7-alpha-hydroxycholest-4-en-3-one 12-alpha-hydroxylase-like [Gadus chalcogrammus]|uniref:7-alpha-hydroxycholest-4-en-3-one 12-alpha-hydroxylase-like n=1 Tax=Gadus chalcogrammus TaxID=1042646 RepID=UPI0024C4E0AD|nr:7-alpha-hydroxycholest-4-en-3-one 12-alpha-hydroxylase-like [Gadus chalcogrammus]
MGLLVPILLALLASLFGGLYLLGAFRRRRPNEPPLDRGPIPWLGHVLEFRRDTAKFLERMRKKHGDIFTVQLGGNYFTFLMDPSSFGAVVKEARAKLDFNAFARKLVIRVFGYTPMENESKFSHVSNNRHLMGDGLVLLTESMMKNLQNLMLHSVGKGGDQKTWIEDGLFMYSYNIVFRAGYLSLYGNVSSREAGSTEKSFEMDRMQSDELFKEFRKYDQYFPKLAYGVLSPRERFEVKKLLRLFWKTLSLQVFKNKDNPSGWVNELQQTREDLGMKEFMQDRYMFLILWASQGNTGPAAFWLLLYLMKHPEAMAAVRGEVDRVVAESGQDVRVGGSIVNLTYDMIQKTPVLDSALEETLRLTAAPVLTRAVMEDMKLKMADGSEYQIRQADRVSLFPYTAVQIDPEIHPDPLSFKYDRFLNPDGSKKTDFYKNGKKLRYYTMPWGAGVSMCPGRFFATNEMKQFVFFMILYFDFELKNPKEETPDIDRTRWGFGAMQPTRDIGFRYRLRL